MPDHETITEAVKSKYSAIAKSACGSGPEASPCCGTGVTDMSTGYTAAELADLPEGAALGLGCGNPIAHAGISPGEIVVDLGSGAGVDCFLAAKAVGERGLVIGIDMTEEMLEKARANAARDGYANVTFRQGEIEEMPVDSGSVDVVISNCVINLAPDKTRVFREIYRVLKPGGRLCVSDVVAKGQIPEEIRNDMEQWVGCVAGAMAKDAYLELVRSVGFDTVEVRAEVEYDYRKTDTFCLASVTVVARKPEAGR